jgi:hypothetical protein
MWQPGGEVSYPAVSLEDTIAREIAIAEAAVRRAETMRQEAERIERDALARLATLRFVEDQLYPAEWAVESRQLLTVVG